jgi:hypothetical protein
MHTDIVQLYAVIEYIIPKIPARLQLIVVSRYTVTPDQGHYICCCYPYIQRR